MNIPEATGILSEKIKLLRNLSYSTLLEYQDCKKHESLEITGMSGVKYYVEIQSFWDDKPNENLRVMVEIYDSV